MSDVLFLVVGLVVGGVGMWLVARNNQKKFIKSIGLDPKKGLDELVKEIYDIIKS